MGFSTGSLLSFGGMLLGGVVGGIVTGGNPAGVIFGASIGGSIGGLTGSILFPEKTDINHPPPPQPRETSQQISTYGATIPIAYASARLAGNIIEAGVLSETIVRSKHRQDGQRYYVMEKSYTRTFAVAFCEGPVVGIARIWLNGNLFADFRDPAGPYYPTGSTQYATGNLSSSEGRAVNFSIHFGEQDQAADTTLVALYGAGSVPAYRGVFYIVFIDFPVGEYNGIPKVEVETGTVNEIVPGSTGINPTYDWTDIDFTLFTITEYSGSNITISAADTANIANTGGDGSYARWVNSFASTGTIKFRFRVVINSIGSMTASTRNLKLLNFRFGSSSYTWITHLWFDNGPPSYQYKLGGISAEESGKVYTTTPPLTRYIQFTHEPAITKITLEIFSDSGFSVSEFSASNTNVTYSNHIQALEILNTYNSMGASFNVTIYDMQYQES